MGELRSDGRTVSEAAAKRKRHPRRRALTRPDPPGKVRAFRNP